jgi:putative acetyltransferase
MFEIRQDDLTGEPTRALLALHMAGMLADTPPEFAFVLDLSGLQQPEITVWSVWDGGEIAGVGALKDLGDRTGELKSMRTAPAHLRKGVAAALLDHLIAEGRARGYRRLSLETGRAPSFDPAVALYRTRGFQPGGPFADYEDSTFNQFMHLDL